jgi:hypothetical protein
MDWFCVCVCVCVCVAGFELRASRLLGRLCAPWAISPAQAMDSSLSQPVCHCFYLLYLLMLLIWAVNLYKIKVYKLYFKSYFVVVINILADSLLSAQHYYMFLLICKTLWGRYYYYLCFTDEKAEVHLPFTILHLPGRLCFNFFHMP